MQGSGSRPLMGGWTGSGVVRSRGGLRVLMLFPLQLNPFALLICKHTNFNVLCFTKTMLLDKVFMLFSMAFKRVPPFKGIEKSIVPMLPGVPPDVGGGEGESADGSQKLGGDCWFQGGCRPDLWRTQARSRTLGGVQLGGRGRAALVVRTGGSETMAAAQAPAWNPAPAL